MSQDENIKLNPLIEADPIPFTMDTIGWKIMFVMLLILIVYLSYRYYVKYKRNAYRREAIFEIQSMINGNPNTTASSISQIMFLLKQTALESYDRKKVASLEGEKWLTFLDSKLNQTGFIKHHDVISSAIYKNEFNDTNSFNLKSFSNMSINWIKKHA
ncbi:DUF4381 domain-containing protein [Psychroserpens jangbogonensis]|uniref:DUF4381 domain-containing protein n=1 Tax=Psychroserpens jangbogonensis TaxID=1484460 RepID=UPI00053D3CB8|nr:DUF4381 domain-containing protein [Psychroserpens jangbogonensis]